MSCFRTYPRFLAHEANYGSLRGGSGFHGSGGDAFNGALALVLAEGRPMQEAIRFANAAGALTVTRKGAQDALPTREEIASLLMQSQG